MQMMASMGGQGGGMPGSEDDIRGDAEGEDSDDDGPPPLESTSASEPASS
jgi:hypothetical protein